MPKFVKRMKDGSRQELAFDCADDVTIVSVTDNAGGVWEREPPNGERAEQAKQAILMALNADWNVSVTISPPTSVFHGNLFMPDPPEQQSEGK